MNEEEKEIFIRYGSAANEALFDFPCTFFRLPQCQGFIGYRLIDRCAVVFGDPIAPKEEHAELAQAFHAYCDAKQWNIIYVIVSQAFAQWARAHGCSLSIEICEEIVFDPYTDLLAKSNRLRHRVQKATKKGLTMHEYLPMDKSIEEELKEIGRQWKQSIKGRNIYLGHLDFFESYAGKRWFYVKEEGKITSMVMLSRLEARRGYLLKFLTTLPGAFPETSEFLVTSVLDTLKKEGCSFLTKGMGPLTSLGKIEGFSPFKEKIVRAFYWGINKTFGFNKRKGYWLRYAPEMEPAYLMFKQARLGFNELRALKKVLRT